MKAHKYEFLSQEINDEVMGGSGEKQIVKKGVLDYYAIAKDIITAPSASSNGFSTDEVVKACYAYNKLKTAYDKGEKCAYLDDETYKFLVVRLNAFRWGMAHPTVLEYIDYVRKLPEEDVTVVS